MTSRHWTNGIHKNEVLELKLLLLLNSLELLIRLDISYDKQKQCIEIIEQIKRLVN